MSTAAFQPLAAYFADNLSETLGELVAPGRNGTTVTLSLDDSGVKTEEGAALVEHLSRLLATGYQAQRPNDHQSHLNPQPASREPARLVLAGEYPSARLQLRTETIAQVPHLVWELTCGPNEGGECGQFVLRP